MVQTALTSAHGQRGGPAIVYGQRVGCVVFCVISKQAQGFDSTSKRNLSHSPALEPSSPPNKLCDWEDLVTGIIGVQVHSTKGANGQVGNWTEDHPSILAKL